MRRGFTLAEVLITLAIIGVVAALTIPTLIQNHQEKVTVSKLKKVYSVFSQAYTFAVIDNGNIENWTNSQDENENMLVFYKNLTKHLKVTKECTNKQVNHAKCFPDIVYKSIGGIDNVNENTTELPNFILNDGTAVRIIIEDANCNLEYGYNQLEHVCGNIYVDINGHKGPNIIGKDAFYFHITRTGIIPHGTQDDINNKFPIRCSRHTTSAGCAAWVIFNENMDYLHCDDLSWNEKRTCK